MDLPANQIAEKAIIRLIVAVPLTEPLEVLEDMDFLDEGRRLAFIGLQEMHQAGQPMDAAAIAQHFQSSKKRKQFAKAKIYNPVEWLLGEMREWEPRAHADYYCKVLRQCRIARGMTLLSVQLQKHLADNAGKPMVSLGWLTRQVGELVELSERLSFPEVE